MEKIEEIEEILNGKPHFLCSKNFCAEGDFSESSPAVIEKDIYEAL